MHTVTSPPFKGAGINKFFLRLSGTFQIAPPTIWDYFAKVIKNFQTTEKNHYFLFAPIRLSSFVLKKVLSRKNFLKALFFNKYE